MYSWREGSQSGVGILSSGKSSLILSQSSVSVDVLLIVVIYHAFIFPALRRVGSKGMVQDGTAVRPDGDGTMVCWRGQGQRI